MKTWDNNIMNKPLPEHIAKIVIEQAHGFYTGKVSSQQAFNHIDQVCGSAWNWYPGILNDSREAFDFAVNLLIVAESPQQWAALLADGFGADLRKV